MEDVRAKMQQALDQYKGLCATERDLLDNQREIADKLAVIRTDIARLQGALGVYQGILRDDEAKVAHAVAQEATPGDSQVAEKKMEVAP